MSDSDTCVVWKRLDHAFKHKNFSDCTFLISENGKERAIKAHILILLMASPEFAIFLDKKNENTFIITDIPFEIFENVLRYMYTNIIDLPRDTEQLASIWYAACKLGLKLLAEQCSQLLKITFENCLYVYKICAKAKKFDQSLHDKLEYKCLKVFTVMTPEVLQSKFFKELEPSFLPALINHEPLNMNEINLFKAVVDFANHKEYKEKKEASTFDAVRSAVKNIRFLEINSENFNIYVAGSGLLNKKETEAIRECIRTGDPSSLPPGFSKKGKRYQSLQLIPAEFRELAGASRRGSLFRDISESDSDNERGAEEKDPPAKPKNKDGETLPERKKYSEYASFSLNLIKLEPGEQSKMLISNHFTLMNLQWKILVLKKLVKRKEYCIIYVNCLGNDNTDWKCHAQMDILGRAYPDIKMFDNISWFCYQRGHQYQRSQSLSMEAFDKLNITMEASLNRKAYINANTSVSVKHDKKIEIQSPSYNQPPARPREERAGFRSEMAPRWRRPKEERGGFRSEMASGGRGQTNYKYTNQLCARPREERVGAKRDGARGRTNYKLKEYL